MTQREIIGKTPHTMRLLLAIALAIIMIAGGFVVLASSQPTATSPKATAAATTASILPNPVMNTNITWSTFYNGWSPLEYSTGSANLTLNTGLSNTYANPISLNPADMVSIGTLQNDKVGSTTWNSKAPSYGNPPAGGAIAAAGNYSIGGVNEPYLTENTSAAAANEQALDTLPEVLLSQLPSNNPQYDYITYGAYLSGAALTGVNANLKLDNGTADYLMTNTTILPGQTLYFSQNLQQINKEVGKGFNLTGSQALTNIQFQMVLNLPTSSSNNTYNLRTFALAITTYPLILGQNASGTQITNTIGNAQLSSFAPTAPATVYNSGYTVATSQQLQNVTIAQTAINNNGYSEQVTYQGTEYLPSAPDLSYSGSTISMAMNVSGKQFTIATLNGISYLSTIQGKANGTFVFDTVNPNNQNSIILQLDYTTAQWNSVSGAPPFFSLQGLEYYWWVGLIGFFSLIGLGSAALAHWGGEEENLRTPKGKFGR